ncbi:hypothetical protein B5S28_g1289 [[Candida] boidinii]|nr:hypothetical protein B5S28_g1289 [[Candida] boidinii]
MDPQIDLDKEKLEYLVNLLKLSKSEETTKNSTLNFDTLLEMVSSTPNEMHQDIPSRTVKDQLETEELVLEIYDNILESGSHKFPLLAKGKTLQYLKYFISNSLPAGFAALDASHPWIIFHLANSQMILGESLSEQLKAKIALTVLSYIDEETGVISGGQFQIAHLAATYAGLCALAIAGNEDAFDEIDRMKVYKFLMARKKKDGSFSMHEDGEFDTRAVYCALCIASLLDILTDELVENTAEWLGKCQTYEGGFGGVPFDEAHGGYSFCAVAGLCILGEPKEMLSTKYGVNLSKLIDWTLKRQYAIEGGLSGRTNKLVDGCYSHWIGGIVPFLEIATETRSIFNRISLQNYILGCCQADQTGGFRDKPGKRADFYHTNYVLSGLGMCQNYQEYNFDEKFGYAFSYKPGIIKDSNVIDNLESNIIVPVDPIFGVAYPCAQKMKAYFVSKRGK